MQSRRLGLYSFLLIATVAGTAYTQMPSRPYHNGSVWQIDMIRTHAGMTNAYLTYLTRDWKREHEVLKQEGLILSYKVLVTEAHNPTDWDVMLMTEYKDLATLEANQEKAAGINQKLFGSDQQIEQGYRDRAAMRDLVGSRQAREIILEPR